MTLGGDKVALLRDMARPLVRNLRFRSALVQDRVRPESVDGVPVPPANLRRLNGGRDFIAMGEKIAQALVDDAQLSSTDDVLDIGCGSGRAALALTKRIGPEGSYRGFDVVPQAVEWCQRRISARHPNFQFSWVDIHSDHYHRAGRTPADQWRFDFEADSFDVVFATSVFTHLGSAATETYLQNAARVLRPGGRLYATFFFIDDVARLALDDGSADIAFAPGTDESWTDNPRDPEAAVGHERATIASMIDGCGLVIDPVARGGRWCNRQSAREYQDVLVAKKKHPGVP